MPTYRSITLSLVSQFDILNIPEYPPLAAPKDPFSSSPSLINSDHSLVSVYIPTYPSSQFWLCYSISAPHPPNAFYYFKLFLNGVCVISWGCGEEDGYKGKTMFGLFDSGDVFFQERTVEKRILCFSSENGNMSDITFDDLNDVMEVRVFRSKGRKRIMPDIQDFQKVAATKNSTIKSHHQHGEGGIRLLNAGLLTTQHPQRYYKYALLDPLDQPFATFRYYYRSWEQLEYLGVTKPRPPSSNSTSPDSKPTPERPVAPAQNSTIADSPASTTSSSSTSSNDAEPSGNLQPAIALNAVSKSALVLLGASPVPQTFPSLSPDKKPVEVPTSRALRPTSITTQAHFADLVRAFSPSKGHRSPTPSSTRVQKSGSMGVLMDVIGSAMRRRNNRAASKEREEVVHHLPVESREPAWKSEEGKGSGDSKVKMGKTRISEGQRPRKPSHDDGEKTTARKSDGSKRPFETSSESESDVSRERRGRTGKTPERELRLWEKL